MGIFKKDKIPEPPSPTVIPDIISAVTGKRTKPIDPTPKEIQEVEEYMRRQKERKEQAEREKLVEETTNPVKEPPKIEENQEKIPLFAYYDQGKVAELEILQAILEEQTKTKEAIKTLIELIRSMK